MGYEDLKLLLASDETFSSAANGANTGDGGLGQQSVDLALEPGGTTEFFRNYDSMGNGKSISLSAIVGTSVVGTGFGDTLEFQMVSLPFDASYLANGAGGAGDGKVLTTPGMTAAANLITFPSGEFQDIPLGTPFFFTNVSTLTNVSVNTIYFFVPINRLSFAVAASLALARVGTTLTTGAGTPVINWTPAMTIHGSSGGILLYNAGVPTDQSALRAGNRIEVPLRPLLGATPRHENSAQFGLPTPATGFHKAHQPLGAGGGGPAAGPAGGPATEGTIAAHANQFYYLRYVASDTITQGAFKKASLVLTGESQLVFPGSGYQVKG